MDPLNIVVIATPGASHLKVLEELPPEAHVTTGNTVEELEQAIGSAQVILNANFNSQPFRTLFPRATSLQWVHSLSAGVEAVLSPEMLASHIPLTNARGVFRDSLGEFCVAAMLFFAKDLRRMLRSQAEAKWDPFDIQMLQDATVGIVGYGEIGRAAAARSHPFGMRVLAVRRRTSLSEADSLLDGTYPPEQLHEMLAQCDYVVVAAPSTPDTRGMINAAAFAHMKRSAVIINVGRGPVIDEAALIAALDSKRIRGAALDVFDQEPLPPGHPFWRMDNVLVSPHCADHTPDWLERAVHKFVHNVKLFSAGKPLDNMVDKKAGY